MQTYLQFAMHLAGAFQGPMPPLRCVPSRARMRVTAAGVEEMELLKASAISVPHSQERQLFPFRRDASWRVAPRRASVPAQRGKCAIITMGNHKYQKRSP